MVSDENRPPRPALSGLILACLALTACGGAGDQTGPGDDRPDPTACSDRIDCLADDDCCPPGCDALSDPDCAPVCGNGVLEPGETCEGLCQIDCDDQDACTFDVPTGAADTCDMACEHEPVERCRHADGCCPAGCDALTDVDCTPLCGNGIVEPGETCDGNCPRTPADCPVDDGCSRARLAGRAEDCDATCELESFTVCGYSDGCCPDGCDALSDDDCEPVCGNSVIEPGETCDGDCPRESADCEDGDACTVALVNHGLTDCESTCGVQSLIVACRHDDGCCPDHCDILTDDDCEPCPLGQHPCMLGCCAWDWETAIPGPTVGPMDLTIDDDGRAHLAHGYFSKSFYHSWREPDGWQTVQGPPAVGTGAQQVIQVDGQGRAHVAWWDDGDRHVYYAIANGQGLWNFCTIAPAGQLDNHIIGLDMALDNLDRPVIAFYDAFAQNPKVAIREGASWTIEEIEAPPGSGLPIAVVTDDLGDLHVAFGSSVTRQVTHARRTGGVWQSEQIGTFKDFKPYVALAVDSTGQPRVTFQAEDGPVVLRLEAGQWSEELVDACQECDLKGLQLVADDDGELHLLYDELHFGRLTYARRAGGRWVKFAVAQDLQIFNQPHLAVDDTGRPFIALINQAHSRVDLARW